MTKESFETWKKKLSNMDPVVRNKTIDEVMPSQLPPKASLQDLGKWFNREKEKPWCELYDKEYLGRHRPTAADYWVETQWGQRKNNPNLWATYSWQHSISHIREEGDLGIIAPTRQIHDDVINMICTQLSNLKSPAKNQSYSTTTNTHTSSIFSQNSFPSIPNQALFVKIKSWICVKNSDVILAKYADFYKALQTENYTRALQLTGENENMNTGYNLAKILLEHQPALDVNINTFHNGNTVIHSATELGNWSLVNLLATHGANTKLASQNNSKICADDYRDQWDPNFRCCESITKNCAIL